MKLYFSLNLVKLVNLVKIGFSSNLASHDQ